MASKRIDKEMSPESLKLLFKGLGTLAFLALNCMSGCAAQETKSTLPRVSQIAQDEEAAEKACSTYRHLGNFVVEERDRGELVAESTCVPISGDGDDPEKTILKRRIIKYSNGQTAKEKVWYNNGALKSVRQWTEEGTPLLIENYNTLGKLDGVKKVFFTDGHLQRKENYKDGSLDGLLEVWHEDDGHNLKRRENTSNGKTNGLLQTWYANGQKNYEGKFDHDTSIGKHTLWFENSHPSKITNYDENGKLHGPSTSWYENSHKLQEATYNHEIVIGRSTQWYENGQVRSIEDRNDKGQKHGKVLLYDEDGTMRNQQNWINGKEEGMQYSYHENGILMQETMYVRGKKHGVSREYDEEGILAQEEMYKNNRIVTP